MLVLQTNRRLKKIFKYLFISAIILFISLLLFVNRFLEPVIRERLHALIIQGSDSLYTYQLGNLDANFFGGNVEVENLHIQIDSNRYRKLSSENALPSLTMELDLVRGRIKGLGVASLLFSRQIRISEILSKEADIKLTRHVHNLDLALNNIPLWKGMQPAIRGIKIERINLDGVKLLYKNADTSASVKLQFDRCVALFNDVRIDSIASLDTTRIGFAGKISMQFYDLKFRTPDSTYKMKAELISYSSVTQLLEVSAFKIQPTLEKEDFYRNAALQKTSYEVVFDKMKFTNLRLDRFIHNNIVSADSLVVNKPAIAIYDDKTLPPTLESKIGRYPHQLLLKAGSTIIIKAVRLINAELNYTEKAEKTQQEGTLKISNLNGVFTNVTNDSNQIKKNAVCKGMLNAMLFDTSPIQTAFTFYLDSTEGEFDAVGEIRNVTATQLNQVAEPLGNTKVQSLFVNNLRFQMHGDNFSTKGNVQMRYNNLAIILRKTDEETGVVKTKKFLTKIVNKFTINPDNPGSDGIERTANNVVYARTSSKGFFGVVWKSIFAGMQNIMLNTGRYE